MALILNKMEKQSTLENMSNKITSRRRDGNTTRLVDNAIQILFEGKICIVKDHHEYGTNRLANKHLFTQILRRLEIEHRWIFENKRININKDKFEINFVEESILEPKLKLGTGVDLTKIDNQ